VRDTLLLKIIRVNKNRIRQIMPKDSLTSSLIEVYILRRCSNIRKSYPISHLIVWDGRVKEVFL